MERLADAVQVIIDKLAAAGIDATDDNRNLNPPAVYVAAPVIMFDRLAGYSLMFDLFAAVPNMGRAQAIEALGDLVLAVRAVWGTDAAYPVDLLIPDQVDPLPAYRIPITVHVGDTS